MKIEFDIDMILTNDTNDGIIEANESDVEDVAFLCDEVSSVYGSLMVHILP